MYFTDNYLLQEIEKMMRRIPNFAPRGYGVLVTCSTCIIDLETATFREIMTETMSGISNKQFQFRLEKYMKESEITPMEFKNEKHRKVFTETIQKHNKKNYALMSALYLLTADLKLWNAVKRCIVKNDIEFKHIHLNGSTENGYTLYCASKDLYLGTKHLSISDLADTELISPKIFGLVCNAMAIRRYGISAIGFKNTTDEKEKYEEES